MIPTQTEAKFLPHSGGAPTCEDRLVPWRSGVWQFRFAGGSSVMAGIADRSCDLDGLRGHLASAENLVLAEQVHSVSLAAVETGTPPVLPIPGCDGLVTRAPGLALVIRTADCLPIFVWDPIRRVIGLVHAGWRGLAGHLPQRLVSLLGIWYGSRPQDIRAGIGPAIRACCYEVGNEFANAFRPFLHERHGRLMCDLIGCAREQLYSSGVRPGHLSDCGACTACEPTRWYSVRREGEGTGRLLSFIMIRPSQVTRTPRP